MSNLSKKEKFIKKAINIHSNKYDYSNVDYKTLKVYVTIKCLKHGFFSQRPDHHLSGSGCQICATEARIKARSSDLKIFINESKKIHGEKYNYSNAKYINSKKHLEIECDIHGLFKQTPDNHLRGRGCPKCSNKNKTTEEIISEFKTIHGDLYNYSLVEYLGAIKKVKIICNNHGLFKQTPDKHKSGNGCPSCKSSKGEIKIEKFLIENKIEFIRQYKFNDCKNINPLPFDFYLPKINVCIEFNGKQHYEPIKHFGGHIGFLKIQNNDNIKKEYCIKNNIKLIEIKYNQDIENILNIFIR